MFIKQIKSQGMICFSNLVKDGSLRVSAEHKMCQECTRKVCDCVFIANTVFAPSALSTGKEEGGMGVSKKKKKKQKEEGHAAEERCLWLQRCMENTVMDGSAVCQQGQRTDYFG